MENLQDKENKDLIKEFKNKTVLVTGATKGIGKEIAIAFGKEAANVAVVGRTREKGAAVAKIINESTPGKAIFIECDVSNEKQVEGMISRVENELGSLDYACNNASIQGLLNTPLHNYPIEKWNEVHNINLTGVWLCMKYEIQNMLKKKSGVIVNISSKAGIRGTKHGACAYASSKHAVVGLSRTAALEYGKDGIRINCICPGTTRTEMMEPILKVHGEEAYNKKIPFGRIAEPIDIANAVLLLCSYKASYITGVTLPVDGGATAG